MKQVTTKDQERIEALKQRITEKQNAIEVMIDQINSVQVQEINELIDELNGVTGDIAREIEEYISNKSEKWQEGNKGTAYQNWMESWQEEMDQMDDVSMPTLPDEFDAPMEPDI